jgi:bacillithiol biosynthesis cysteine-adding enzyme BshC
LNPDLESDISFTCVFPRSCLSFYAQEGSQTGALPVRSECLPFGQIPHTTRLFTDFLAFTPSVRPFYPRSPYFSEWMKQENPNQRYEAGRRQRVSDVLERVNKGWGASARTLKNLARFRSGACAALTGQQVGLFGGPLFALFKALTAVKLAAEASAAGVDCVPIFWLATEDHDLEEVSHTAVLGPDGLLQDLSTAAHGVADAPVGTIQFGSEMEELAQKTAGLLGDAPVLDSLKNSYRPGETFGSAFAKLFASLFSDWGVILLDSSDPELHAICEPIFRAAIERAAEIDEDLLERGKQLESAGYHQQVKITPSSTLVFTYRNGARTPIHRVANGTPRSFDFLIDDERISQSELLNRIQSAPDQFSANVLLRPVLQDYLLPTLAYTGGASEVAYFAQAAVVYEKLLGHVTPMIPRFSATLVEPKADRLLERYGIKLPDLFHDHLRETLAQRTLPAELQSAFDNANQTFEKSLSAIRDALAKLDPTLVEAANRAGSKMQYQIEHLRASAARAELRQTELLSRHAEVISSMLYPNKSLQEREVGGLYFLAKYGSDLLQQIYSAMHTDCLDHQIIHL